MFFGRREDEARCLEAEGRARLEAQDFPEVLELAGRLIDMSWSGGFELRALAQRGAGDLKLARGGLEHAVTRAPDAGPLWLLLGNLRSDAGHLELAEAAFEQALRCDREEGCQSVSEATLRFNRAITRGRNANPEGALADLDFVLRLPTPPAFAEDALWLAMECLVTLERGDEALALSAGVLDKCRTDDPRRARLLGLRALVLDLSERPAAEIDEALREAVDAGCASQELLGLARRRWPVVAEDKVSYRLIVQGRAHRPEADGFFRVFDVVAADPEQALSICRTYLPAESRAAASLHGAEVVEASSELEPCCHSASELMFFADA